MNIQRKRYIQTLIALVAVAIVAGSLLVNSPRVQQRVSVLLATELENRIGTRVSLGGVRWLFPNDIIIDSLSIDDQEGEQLLAVNRLAAKVEWMPLIRHRHLSIRNVRLFHPDIHIYKPTHKDDYNYKFLIDAFASKKEKAKEPPRLSLRINTLLVRHARFKHHIGDTKGPTAAGPRQPFTTANILIEDLSTQMSLKTLSADSISIAVRHLKFKEHSGLCVDDCYLRLVGNRQGATLANLRLDLPHSTLRLDTVWVSYQFENSKLKIQNSILKGKILSTSHITPCDLGWLFPQVGGITEKIRFDADFIGSTSRINLKKLNVSVGKGEISLRADGMANLRDWKKNGCIDLNLHEASLTDNTWALLAEQAPDIHALIPQEVIRIGNMATHGNIHLASQLSHAELYATTDAGTVETNIKIDSDGHYTTHIIGQHINIAQIIPSSPLTGTNITLNAEGIYQHRNNENTLPIKGTFQGLATQAELFGYSYERIELDGAYGPDAYSGCINLDDPNGSLQLRAEYKPSGEIPIYGLQLQADTLNLHAMKLIQAHEGNRFSTRLRANIQGVDFNHFTGRISIDSLTLHKPDEEYTIKQIALYGSDSERKMLSLSSDFMEGSLQGEFTYQLLPKSLITRFHHYLPSVCRDHRHTHQLADNLCTASLKINDARPLNEFLLLPISFSKPISIEGIINDHTGGLNLQVTAPELRYAELALSNLSLHCEATDNGANCRIGGIQHSEDGISTTATLVANANNDKVALGVLWNSNQQGLFEGALSSNINFKFNEEEQLGITILCDSSYAIINHSPWRLDPFRADIKPGHILIDSLHFANNTTQHLSINGGIAEHNTDTLQISFTDLDLGYLLSLVKLEGISFDGQVSGKAEMADLYSEHPHIDANIQAEDFAFCDGPMGEVDGHIYWNEDNAQLQFVADVWENPEHISVVDGIVDLKRDELWLDIAADSLNTAFLNTLLNSFMADVKGNASGNLTVGGPMNAIDLKGALLADVAFNLTPTNATYRFRDSLRFTPGVIHFDGIEAFDIRNQKGIVAGTVTHDKLKDFSCDLYVDVQNILGIDLPNTGHDSFYTTIYGTGGVQIKSTPTTPLTIEVQAQPEKGSVFALNLANQSETSSEAFITFTDRSSTRNVPTIATERTVDRNRRRRRTTTASTPSTNIDITAHVTPDATLKLVMNQAVDDHISATGSGDLQIGIHGDDISLFGTYTVERGFYRLSLQDVINKNFDVLSGSTVSFEGDPMAARLDITARHTVNYVPLRDLSPDMTGNVHVNCLLRIGGTLDAPTLTFALELPQGSEEEKAMLASYTNTAEQVNLQFIYLLGLGKFYTPDMAQNTQGTTNNMESFISSTISGQINNLLAGIISNENWNLASNLRAENMMTGESDLDGDNWENMEIEGILEGRLLNNRLLINGSFGYRENPMYATNFIGDFDIRYLLTEKFSLKGYNKTNDRYFSKTSLTTQGIGVVYQRDFEGLLPHRKRKQAVSTPTDSLSVR